VTVDPEGDAFSYTIGRYSPDSADGLIRSTSIGCIATTIQYNGYGEVSLYTVEDTCLAEPTYELRLQARDQLGRIGAKFETGKSTLAGFDQSKDYFYDPAGRLEEVLRSGDPLPERQFSYDANGNRQEEISLAAVISYQYDNQDRLEQYGADTTYTYTDNGELATKTTPAGTTTYGYDVLGSLRSVLLPDNTTIDYLVDGLGRRVGKVKNGSLVRGFIYKDGLNPIAELGPSGDLRNVFVYATKSNVPDLMINYDTGVKRVYRLISDQVGSVRLVVDTDTGEIAQRIDYTVFGKVEIDTNPGFQPFGFAGGIYDPDTGLVRFGARDYDPQVGRWTAKDPILFAGGDTNLYGYVLNDPVNLTDPAGTVSPDTAWHYYRSPGAREVEQSLGDPMRSQLAPLGKVLIVVYGMVAAYYGGVVLKSLGLALAPYVTPAAAATANWARRWWQRVACRGGQAARAINRNDLHHIFGKPKHNLGALIERFGSQEATYRAVEAATQVAGRTQGLSGLYETTVTVAGQDVVVRGKVMEGVVRIGTFYIR
jgi:RHS repeat-associated protein